MEICISARFLDGHRLSRNYRPSLVGFPCCSLHAPGQAALACGPQMVMLISVCFLALRGGGIHSAMSLLLCLFWDEPPRMAPLSMCHARSYVTAIIIHALVGASHLHQPCRPGIVTHAAETMSQITHGPECEVQQDICASSNCNSQSRSTCDCRSEVAHGDGCRKRPRQA